MQLLKKMKELHRPVLIQSVKKVTRRRVAPAYFSPNYKYFDQLLRTVKSKTTVLILVFQRIFININSTTDFCTLCKRVSRLSVDKFLSHSAEKFRRGTLLCLKISGIEKC